MAPLDDIQVGDVVNVPGGMYGTVRYLGSVAGKQGRFAGIELAPEHAKRGKNNGDVEGRKYFKTTVPGSGIFVPMNNNRYVTKRSSTSAPTVTTAPPTPSRPINFSKSVGPSPAVPRPRVRRPSLPRPESPRGPPPSKLSLAGLRTPSTASRAGPSPNGYPRSPVKAPSRASDRTPSRMSMDDDLSSVRTSDFHRSSMASEVQELKDQIKSLEKQLLDRDKQLEEQANTLAEFQRTIEDLEGSDALSIRAQLREKNERIAQLTAEFDLHRADFRSTLDTLEIAASETERVYEQRLDELMQQNKELQDRGEDVEAVARQLKQLEELVSELEEGLEDARRGEAEARAEVEFLRGEVERTKLELKKERENSSAMLREAHSGGDGGRQYSKELDQKDDEIRGLKAIIHSLSRGDPNFPGLQNGLASSRQDHDSEHIARLEQRIQEFEHATESKNYRIEELERELQQLRLSNESRTRSSTISAPAPPHKPSNSAGYVGTANTINHAHRLSDRTVVPNDWQEQPHGENQYQPFGSHHSLFHPFQAIHMSHAMEDDALHQLQQEQSKLLDKIDELRTIGVGGLVELPQLIVCGNQSSGKSSVLEAITRVRFPAKSNVCTRFATEVILRRNAAFSKIKVSIEPGPSRTDEDERRRLRSFTYEDFSNGDDLPPLIEKAKVHMGITESVNTGFSDDVLKVEISGPDKPELTLVDLPGLYYSTSQEQDLQGILIVRKLTERYMSNPRSIILAVISAKTDYHLQEVLNIAEQFDPKRERTLGIITQPDILEANSEEEDTYLHFVKNEKIPLELGWHVLRNRSFETRDISDDARDEMEKAFFNQGRWASLSRECVGIESLRRRLSGVLLKLIRRNLPGLITEIQDKVSDRQQRLSKLGPGRSTLQQQRGYLLGISSKFERITMQALNGMYADDFFGGLDGTSSTEDFRRLRAVIRQLNEYFADAMAIRGCRRKIVDVHPLFGKNHHKLAAGNPYTDIWEPEYVERSSLEAEVSKQARNNRGIELPGNANQLLVGSLFRDQSKPWEGLAKEHLMKAWESARYFTWLVLQHITDDHTSSLLIGSIIDPELERLKQSLLEKLDELTAYAKRGHPLPLGKSFLSQVQKARSNRQLESLRSKLLFAGSEGNEGELYTMKDIEQATSAMETSRDEFAAAEIIDQMQAYYETAIVTFVDNVAILGIENCLLDPLQRIFTSQVVNNMDDGQVRELSMEPPYIHAERERLAWELDKLQAGLRALRVFTPQKPSFSSLPPLIKKPAPGLSNGLNPSEKSPPAPTMPSYHGKPFAGKEWSELLSSPGPAKDNRKYAKSKSPKPSSVPESAGTSSAPFGNLFGPGLPEHKVAPVVFGAGEFEHKRFCMDVSTNPREEKHDSGASGTSISENKSVFGGHRTKV